MDFEAVSNVIKDRFGVEIEDAHSIPTHYDNAPFTQPTNATWVRLKIKPDESDQPQFGGLNTFRNRGEMVAEIFIKINTGDQEALNLGDKIVAAFRNKTDTGVKFLVPRIGPGMRDGKNWRTDVFCPYYADDNA